MLRFIFKSLIILVVAAIIVCLFAPAFMSWSPINCKYQDVDIKTGRARYTRYLLYCKVSERIEETPLSRLIPKEMREGAEPDWRRVNTFSGWGGHSPHHTFHGAFAQIRMIDYLFESPDGSALTDEMKRKIAIHILAIWQHTESYFSAGNYIDSLCKMMQDHRSELVLKNLMTLEVPLVENDGQKETRTLFFPDGSPMERIEGRVDPSGKFIRHGKWERWDLDGEKMDDSTFENDQMTDH